MPMIARDSEERTVRAEKLDNGPTITVIFDPVAEKHIDYISDLKVANVLPLPSASASSGRPDFSRALEFLHLPG
jgi:hypothetical protein